MAIEGLLRRTLGQRAVRFRPYAIPADESGNDVFEVRVDGETVALGGSLPLAQAAGLRWYLRHGERLPQGESVRKVAAFEYRYYYNFCTFGYTMPFWDWPRWEAELDRLAMYGVNLPLSAVGQEAIWQRVCRRFGMSDDDIREFLGGPAYLPWLWMGCLSGWDGPMSQRWIDQHAELGQRIVARARELGMRPVLPAFAGHVPAQLAAGARTTEIEWAGFRTRLLDATDPLFAEISAVHLEEQAALLGDGDHLYAADPFIEVVPPAERPEDVAGVARTIYEGMRRHDPKAVWVLQSWPFSYMADYWTTERKQAFLDAVPDDRMMLLDLWSDHKPVAAGLRTTKPWVWCLLNNFGGRPGLYGNLAELATEPGAARDAGARGVGASMEDFLTNPVLYDLLADVSWDGAVDADDWLEAWVRHRYADFGSGDIDSAVGAWRLLAETVYASREAGPPGAVALRRPRVDGDLVHGSWLLSEAPRSEDLEPKLFEAWRLLLGSIDRTHEPAVTGAAGRDLADVTFAVLTALGNVAQSRAAEAYLARNADEFAKQAREFLDSIDLLERLLATRPEYLLGRWLAEARRWGDNEVERQHYETDALRLLTLWGAPDGMLVDYGRRGWSGLVGDFYRARWQRWVDYLSDRLGGGRAVEPDAFDASMIEFECGYVEAAHEHELSVDPVGNTAEVAAESYTRFAGYVEE